MTFSKQVQNCLKDDATKPNLQNYFQTSLNLFELLHSSTEASKTKNQKVRANVEDPLR